MEEETRSFTATSGKRLFMKARNQFKVQQHKDQKLRYRLEALMCCVRGPEAEIQTGGTNVPCTGT